MSSILVVQSLHKTLPALMHRRGLRVLYLKKKGESAMKQPKLQLNNEDKPCRYIINHKVINRDIKDEIRFIK